MFVFTLVMLVDCFGRRTKLTGVVFLFPCPLLTRQDQDMLETESIFETMSAILASWKKHREAVQSDQIAPEDVQGVGKRVRLIFH